MDLENALIAFDALSQETRLRVFRLLVGHGPDGAAAGALSDALEVPHNTLSFHLSHLSHSGLIQAQRKGRSIIYRANFDLFTDLIRFMVMDCCDVSFAQMREDKKRGCSIIELTSCCQPANKR